MKRTLCLGLFAAMGWLVAACGGGKNSACSEVAACGGSVVGNWKITGTCVNATGNAAAASGLTSSCPNASVGNTSLTQTGTVSYKSDMTFTETMTVSGSVSVMFPASCLTQMGVTVSCEQINQIFKSLNMMTGTAGSSGGASGSSADFIPDIHCTSAGGGCSCTTSIPMQTSTSSGTYSTSGSTLTQDGSVSDYCVKGDKLYIKAKQGTSMTTGMGNVSVKGQIELQKQ